MNSKAESYSAFCVKFTGERFIKTNLFSKDDHYFRIADDEKIFIVRAESQHKLKSLCPNGSRLVSKFTKVRISEQITPFQYVREGHYLKNPEMYQLQGEVYEVRTDNWVVR